MTVKQLKEAIKDLPDDMNVMIHQTWDESPLSESETATVRLVTFAGEDFEPEDYGKRDCLVISDEL